MAPFINDTGNISVIYSIFGLISFSMKKLYILIALLFPVALAVTSCKPEEKVKPEIVDIPQAVKDYAFFKVGSWWVYKDSVTGQFDTITVITARSGIDTTINNKGAITAVHEWFTSTLESSHDGYKYDVDLHSSWKDNLTFIDKHKPGNFAGQRTYLFTPYDIGNVRGSACSDNAIVTITNKYDSIKQLSKIYNNCLEFTASKSCIDSNKQVKYILAEKVGLIQKTIGNNENHWQLLDYSIVP